MADTLSLEQLVHLSLGDPEAGAVNFNVLKTLLLQMLKAMNLFNFKPAMTDDDQRTLKEALTISSTSTTPSKRRVQFGEQDGGGSTSLLDESGDDQDNEAKKKTRRKRRDRSLERLNALEEKVFRFESQLNALDQIPSNAELIDRAKQVPRKTSDVGANQSSKDTTATGHRHGPILEIWQYTQLEKRVESAENGVTRLVSLLQDLLSDMNDLKESHENIKQTTDDLKKQQEDMRKLLDQLNKEKNEWAKKSDVDNLEEKIRNLQNLLSSLRDRLDDIAKNSGNPVVMPDLTGLVTWDRLEDALRGIRESVEKSSTDAAAALASARDKAPHVQVVERPSQTSAPIRRRSPSAEHSDVPSNRLTELLEQLGTLNDRHEQLRALVEALERKKLNRDDFDALKNQQNDLYDRLLALERLVDDLQSRQRSDVPAPTTVREIIKEVPQKNDYSGDMADFRTALQRLREDLDRLRQLLQDLINKGNLTAQDIEALRKALAQLEQMKADKAMMTHELDKKADKREVDNRVLKKDFQTACGELSQNLNDYMQKFNVHEDGQKQDLDRINQDVDGKIDRTELEALRDYVEKQLKKLKKLAKETQTQPHVHMMSEDEAAGLRKQLIRFHCISCDRPIDVQPHPQQPSLPANQGMRPIQSPRPYTTYELDQIRQYQKSQQFSHELSGGLADVYATIRQCGGSHTMTLPFKRQIKTQPTVPEETILTRSEVDIKGHDGVIYKGRIDVGKLPAVDLHKKNSVVMLTPAPPLRSRSDSHPRSAHHHHQQHHSSGDFSNHDHQNEHLTHVIPNIEPALPREETFT